MPRDPMKNKSHEGSGNNYDNSMPTGSYNGWRSMLPCEAIDMGVFFQSLSPK
jgi:hypothetical protein